MPDDATTHERSPYLLGDPPASSGRVLLARGFQHYCTLHWGLSGNEILTALGGGGDPDVHQSVLMATRLFGGLLATGAIPAWARPFGGGDPVQLRASTWELDDFTRRFATSAIDPRQPFDGSVAPTHWIFADLEAWNRALEASVADVVTEARHAKPSARHAGAEIIPDARTSSGDGDRLIRLPEVLRRTGMSRATVYRKMKRGSFPGIVPMTGNMSFWREPEVSAWIADPR